MYNICPNSIGSKVMVHGVFNPQYQRYGKKILVGTDLNTTLYVGELLITKLVGSRERDVVLAT